MDPSENEGEDEKESEEPPQAGEEREEVTAQKRKEIEAIQRAMNEENERVGTDHSAQSTSREEEDGHKLSRGTVLLYVLSSWAISFNTCTWCNHILMSINIFLLMSDQKTITWDRMFSHCSLNRTWKEPKSSFSTREVYRLCGGKTARSQQEGGYKTEVSSLQNSCSY